MPIRPIEVSTFSKIPSFVPFGVEYFTQDTADLYVGTGASSGPAVVAVNAGGGGTVSSVTFTGDGTVLSNTPSAAVTTAGTLSAALATAGANTVLGNATASAAAPSYGQVVNGQIANATIDLTTKVTGVLPAANGGSAPIFSTPVTGAVMATSGSNTVVVGPVAMTTPGANGTYRFVVQIIVTAAGSGGTCTAGSVGAELQWKDADTAVTYTFVANTPNIPFYPASNTAITGAPANSTSAPASANDWTSVPREFRAASGTAISYQIAQQTNSNCTTPPVFAVRPALYYMGY